MQQRVTNDRVVPSQLPSEQANPVTEAVWNQPSPQSSPTADTTVVLSAPTWVTSLGTTRDRVGRVVVAPSTREEVLPPPVLIRSIQTDRPASTVLDVLWPDSGEDGIQQVQLSY